MSKRSKRRLIKFTILILILFTVLLSVFEIKIRPTINNVAKSRAKNLAIRVISKSVSNTMLEYGAGDENFILFEKNSEDNITAVKLNVVYINKLKSNLITEVEKNISKIDTMTCKIPLGNLLNLSILSGWGPRIAVSAVPVGSVGIDINNNFISAGINQTKVEIYLNVSCSISVLLPLWSDNATVHTRIPVCETVIVGNVPSTFTNVEGQEEIDEAVLNIIPD